MKIEQINVSSYKREEFIDITHQVKKFVKESKVADGKITIYVPHTTAAVTINENADPSVPHDITLALNKISPSLSQFRHLEGNSDAHTKSTIVGCSQEILISNGNLVLGTWQGIFFCEFDGPRNRKVILGIA